MSDGHGAHFPSTKVKFPKKTHVFPTPVSVLTQPVRAKIHELGLLEPKGSELTKRVGDDVWTLLTEQRRCAEVDTSSMPRGLLTC